MTSFTKRLRYYEVNYGLIAHPRLKNHYSPSEQIEVVDEQGHVTHTKLHSTRSRIDGLTLWHFRHNTQIDDTVTITIDDGKKLHLQLTRSARSQKRIDDLVEKLAADQYQTLDELVDESIAKESLFKELKALDLAMENVEPKRIQRVVSNTIRNDTKLVQILKEVADYRCQFPGCNSIIKKKDGTYYVEVAHVRAVSAAGRSVLGNLVVFCPNHHKEFDLGDLRITFQSIESLTGTLNGLPFSIELIHV